MNKYFFLTIAWSLFLAVGWGQTIFTWDGEANDNDWNNSVNWDIGTGNKDYPGGNGKDDVAVFPDDPNLEPINVTVSSSGNSSSSVKLGEIQFKSGTVVNLTMAGNLEPTTVTVEPNCTISFNGSSNLGESSFSSSTGSTISFAGSGTITLSNVSNNGGTLNLESGSLTIENLTNFNGGKINVDPIGSFSVTNNLSQSGASSAIDLGEKTLQGLSTVDLTGGTIKNGSVLTADFVQILNMSFQDVDLEKTGGGSNTLNGNNGFIGVCTVTNSSDFDLIMQNGSFDVISNGASVTYEGLGAGALQLANVEDLVVRGNLSTLGGVSFGSGQLIFGGNQDKTFTGAITVQHLSIGETDQSPPGRTSITGSINVSSSLTMNSGVVETGVGGELNLLGATVDADNSDSHVDGPLNYQTSTASPTILSFPIGKGGVVRPVDLDLSFVASPANTTATITVELFNESAQSKGTIPENPPEDFCILDVSDIRYWEINCQGCAGSVDNAVVSFEYRDRDAEGISDINSIVIAKSDGAGGGWMNLGRAFPCTSQELATAGCTLSANGCGLEGDACVPPPSCSEDGNLITSSIGFNSFSVFTLATISTLNALPVELLSFTAAPTGNDVRLNWRTATESGNDYFAVEHSTDGSRFRELGRVAGAGDSAAPLSYDYPHADVPQGIHYYRLRQVDFDGSYEYSEVVSVQIAGAPGALRLFPNPAREEVQLLSAGTEALRYDLFDAFGRLLRSDAVAPQGRIDISGLTQGTYLLRVSSQTGAVLATERVVKM